MLYSYLKCSIWYVRGENDVIVWHIGIAHVFSITKGKIFNVYLLIVFIGISRLSLLINLRGVGNEQYNLSI